MALRIAVAGASGRVGKAMMAGLAHQPNVVLVGGFGRAEALHLPALLPRIDALIDFTTPESAPEILLQAARAGVRPVSGTSGLPVGLLDEVDALLRERSRAGVWAANFAIGAAVMSAAAQMAAKYMQAAEIIEMHHDGKLDAPSATAIATARSMRATRDADLPNPTPARETIPGARGAVEGGVRLHSVRLPGLVAHQEVLFGSPGELLTFRHDALDRSLYVSGVLMALRHVAQRDAVGLVRGLATLMGLTAE